MILSKKFYFKQIITSLLVIIPPLILGWLVWRCGVNVPFWDQWETPGQLLLEADRGKLTWNQWMRQHNESRTLFPNLLFLTVANLTNWNTRYEMLITFLLACLVSFNIYRLSKITLDGNNLPHLICFSLANLLIFSPMQYENWLWGFQGITFTSIAAITTSFVCIFSSTRWITKFLVSAVLASIATFSFGNGILCWGLILPALLLKSIQSKVKIKWIILGWLFVSSINLTIYFYDYQRPTDLPSLTQVFVHPILAISYFLGFIGSPLSSQDLLLSQIFGLVSIIIFSFACFYFLALKQNIRFIQQSFPWLLISCYVLASAAMTTASRMSLGIEQSLSSRYLTFSTYLTISLIYLLTIILINFKRKTIVKLVSGFLITAFLIIYIDNFILGVNIFVKFHYYRAYGKACVIMINLIDDKQCIKQHIHPIPEHLQNKAREVDEIGFLQPGLIKNVNWQNSNRGKYGEFDTLSRNLNGDYNASGWAITSQNEPSIDTIILAYQNPDSSDRAFALAELDIKQKDVIGVLSNPKNTKLSWQKTFTSATIPAKAIAISAWAFDTNTGKAYKLNNIQNLDT